MKFFHMFLIALTLLHYGCGYKEGVATNAQESYLYFSGRTEGISVSIDGGEMFPVQGGIDNKYKIKPGKHNIHVFQSENIVVDRHVYVGNGISKEIEVQ
jgi:hypothetical protein